MSDTKTLTVELPSEMVADIHRLVDKGKFEDPADVLREGAEMVLDQDAGLETWLRDVVLPRHEESLNNPDAYIPADKVLDEIKRLSRLADAG